LVALVAAWGGIVAYAGPTFDFTMGNTAAWTWTQGRATLHFAPALAGILGGLLLLVGRTRPIQQLGSLLGVTAGIWFVIGPSLEPLWTSGSGGSMSMGHSMSMGGMQSETKQALEAIGYHYGTGAVLATLAAIALGLLVAAPAVVATGEPIAARRERLRFRPRVRTQQ
jgi:hypothetical protein